MVGCAGPARFICRRLSNFAATVIMRGTVFRLRTRGDDAGMTPPNSSQNRTPRVLLRRADQAAVASITLIALLVLGAYEWRQWRGSHGTIDIERTEPMVAEFQVDINRAEWPEIAQIPDLGETLARRLVENRLSQGPFRDFSDLRNRVKGIGPKTMDKIAPYLQPISPEEFAAQSPGKRASE